MQVWREKSVGLQGLPSVDEVIAVHGNSWHRIGRTTKESNKEKAFKYLRKFIWDEIDYLKGHVEGGSDLERGNRAAERLEDIFQSGEWTRDGQPKTLANFQKYLRKTRKIRAAVVGNE